MGNWKRIAVCGLIGAALAGCSSEADRQTKMNQDRAAMQLTQAQHECDDYKAQIDQLKNDLQMSQKQAAATTADLKDQLAKAQMDCVDSTKKQQEDEKELAELRTQVDSLRHAAPTTAP